MRRHAIQGLVLAEHEFTVPLDHARPEGETIAVFARVHPAQKLRIVELGGDGWRLQQAQGHGQPRFRVAHKALEVAHRFFAGVPALFLGVLCCGGPHGSVPHGHGELLVTQGIRAVQGGGSGRRNANQPGLLGFAAGGTAEVEVTGGDDGLGALVDQLNGDVAGGDRIALAVQVDQLKLFAEHAALLVELVHCDLGALQGGLIQRRLDTGQAQGGANLDVLGLRRGRTAGGEQQAEDQQDGQQSPVLQFLVHLFSPC